MILEQVITESESLGPVVIVGDFNAHLGKLGGSRGLGDPNVQGVLLHDLLDGCELNVVSLGSLSSGETYTYRSGSTTTIVDYVLMDLDAVSLLRSCETLSEADLNISNHLPLAVDMMCGSVGKLEEGDSIAKIDWDGARRSGDLLGYMAEVKERLAPFLNGSYIDVGEVDEEIRQVA